MLGTPQQTGQTVSGRQTNKKMNEFIEIMPSSLNKQSDVIEENWGGRRMLDEEGWSRKTSLSR